MYHCEQDLLDQLVVLSPKNARKEFRYHIFEAWNWRCAYCDKKLTTLTATVDHIIPKFKGGHNVKSNMCCCCSSCNKEKGSTFLEEWYTPEFDSYCKERFVKIKNWMEQKPSSLKLLSADKAQPYIANDFYIGWVTS